MQLPQETVDSTGEMCANRPPSWTQTYFRVQQGSSCAPPPMTLCRLTKAQNQWSKKKRGVRGEEAEEGKEGCKEGPISSNASLADGLLLLGKIAPLLIRPPEWLYNLHLLSEGAGRQDTRQGEAERGLFH